MKKPGIPILAVVATLQTVCGWISPPAAAQPVEIRTGILHTSYTLEGPYTLDVITVDLRAKEYTLESFRPDSLTTTSTQVSMAEAGGASVIAAVNADFFSFKTHWPVGNQVVDGVPVTGLKTRRTHISISSAGRVRFGPASFAGVAFVDGEEWSLAGLNAHDVDGSALVFTRFWGRSTRTPESRTDVQLRMISPHWVSGDTTYFVAYAVQDEGNASLAGVDAVLSITDSLGSISAGDTVKLVLTYGDHTGHLRTLLGGAGTILDRGAHPLEGNRLEESIGKRFITDRHPRTFVAINKDTSTFFLCTVDGRQPSSLGMNFVEMGSFLLSIGAWHGINFDGGGSTTMVVDGTIVNSPSDKTGERAVANTLLVVEERSGGSR